MKTTDKAKAMNKLLDDIDSDVQSLYLRFGDLRRELLTVMNDYDSICEQLLEIARSTTKPEVE